MKCFEITINGNKVCTAGVGDDGVLVSGVTFVRRKSSDEIAGSQKSEEESLDIRVSGVANREGGEIDHLDWLHRELEVGDEVVIRIVEASLCDEPQGKEVSFMACSFCEQKQMEVSKLIAGPAVFICDECVGDCKDAMQHGEPTGKITIVVRDKAQASCSFCGRKPDEVERIVGVPTAHICSECIAICGNILADDVNR